MTLTTSPPARPAWLPPEALPLRDRRLWLALAGLLAVAGALRLLLHTGFFGADEVAYLDAAVRMLHGDWTPSTYIGAVRYGFQLPMAGFMAVFGQNEFAANLWTLLASLAEITAVVLIGNALIGLRAALLGGILLAFLPLHVHFSGRLMADPPLALFMTLSFLLFWLGNRQGRALAFLCAGLAAGGVYWVKEVTAVYLLVFLTFPLVFRCWNWKWLWMLAGFALMFAANCLLLWALSGDPFYIPHVAAKAASDYASGVGRFGKAPDNDDPLFYFDYLFVRVYHLWLLGYLVLAALFFAWRKRKSSSDLASGSSFVVWWALGLILLFSVVPVSLQPLKFMFKQVNYMLMFAAPLAVLAGIYLARVKPRTLAVLLTLMLVPMFFLGALEKNAIAVFTANSKAAVGFAREHAGVPVYGPTGAQRAATFFALTDPAGGPVDIRPIEALVNDAPCAAGGKIAYAIVDPETMSWGNSGVRALDRIPECWRFERTLKSSTEISLRRPLELLSAAAQQLPSAELGDKIRVAVGKISVARPALVYAVGGGPGGNN